MLNILPHTYQKVGKWIILIMLIIPACLGLLNGLTDPFSWTGDEVNNNTLFLDQFAQVTYGVIPDIVANLLVVIGITLYFISKDKIQDPFLDSLKLKAVCILFVMSAIVGFVFSDSSIPLMVWSVIQVSGYIIILWILKKQQNEIFTTT